MRVASVAECIQFIRGCKVILDRDLAALYGVETRALNQAVARNRVRFPEDFLLELTPEEARGLVSQNVIPTLRSLGGRMPYAFTEQGVAMLSSVLRSPRAIAVNIEIMRAFVRLRGVLASHKELAKRLDELEGRYDAGFRVVFDAIRRLMARPEKPRPRIGFKP